MSLTRFIKKGELTVCLFLFDLLFLTFLLYLSFLFRLYLFPIFFSSFFPLTHSFKKYLCLIFVYLLIFIYGGSYKRIFCWDEVKLIWESVIITTVVIFFMLFVTNQFEQYSVSVIIIWLSLCFLLLPIIRPIIKSLLYKAGIGKARLLIIGAGKKVEKFLNAIEQEKNLGYEVVGFLDNFWEDIDRDIEFLNIDAVAIIMNNMSEETISKLVNKIYHKVNTIFYIFDIPEMPTAISKLRNFFKEDMFAIEVENKIKNPFNYILKRGFDLVISFFLLPFIILFLVFVSIFIRLTSKGPAILSQERVGKNGRIFKCYKLRTMYEDADKKLEEILRNDPNAKREWENSWKLKNDPRITPIGKFL
ncbi:MAG: sugar transferase, partial [Candidatus Omnitrophica bacterium]|nr:sugar transferase [Candidatus Omnitrophota bacterium]